MRRVVFAVFGVLAMSLAGGTIARADALNNPWSVETGPSIRLGNQDSDFGVSSPWTALLAYDFSGRVRGESPIWYGYGHYLWSTSDNIHTSAWGLGIGMRTTEQWYLTSALAYYYINAAAGLHNSGVGGYVGGGYDFWQRPNVDSGPYIETKYNFLPSRSGVNNSSLGVTLGYRF